MLRISSKNYVHNMSAENRPAAEVSSGSKVIFEANDCFNNYLNKDNLDLSTVDWNQVNPATGPLKITEAKIGDVLKIEIEKITVNDYGVMLAEPELVFLDNVVEKPRVKLIKIEDDQAIFSEKIKIDLNPMIGVIGVAPAKEKGAVPCDTPDSHGGNMDAKIIKENSTLYLPVNVEGGMLALGDLHAAMADGEIVSGIEVSGEVELRVTVIKERTITDPILENKDYLYTIASDKDLYQACRKAANNMFEFLQQRVDLEKTDLAMLMSLICDIEICQVVDPQLTARVKVEKNKLKNYKLNFN